MSPMLVAIIWFVITAVFLALEFISSKYVLPIAMGAGVAGIATLFSLSVLGQVIVFVVVTVLAYILFKPNKGSKDGSGKSGPGKEYDEDFYD